jgi:hypothetical protein
MKSTFKDVEDSFDHNLYKLISEFQESFPDRHGFRQKLIEIAIDFQKTAQVRNSAPELGTANLNLAKSVQCSKVGI